MKYSEIGNSMFQTSGEAYGYAKAYFQVKKDQVKLEIAERSSKVISSVLTIMVVALFVGVALIFGGVALALYLATLTGSLVNGFLLTAGIIALMAGIVFVIRKPLITNPVIGYIIRKIYE